MVQVLGLYTVGCWMDWTDT